MSAAADVQGEAKPAVSIRGLRLSFAAPSPGQRGGQRTVLANIDLDVREGEFLCIVGASGSGKTSLLRILAGLIRPTEGEARFRGQAISGPSRDRAIVFQDYSKALLPWRTVGTNVALGLESRGVTRAAQGPVVDQLLERMGLADAKEQYPSQLSGGMQQRVQIARCLAQAPQILLMDEPFGALDALTRQALQDEILFLTAEKRITAVFITHDLEEAIRLADRIFLLSPRPAQVVAEIPLTAPRSSRTEREVARIVSEVTCRMTGSAFRPDHA